MTRDGSAEQRMRRLRYVAAMYSDIWVSFGPGSTEQRFERLNRLGVQPNVLAVVMPALTGPDSVPGDVYGAETWAALFDEHPMDDCIAA